jgi:hypothetical protein
MWYRSCDLTGKEGVEPPHAALPAWPLIRNQAPCRSVTSPLLGGRGSLARLLSRPYGPGFVAVVFGIDSASVSRREIRDEAQRTLFLCHISSDLRVSPSLSFQSDSAYCTSSRLEHRYAASLRSDHFRMAYKPSGVCENTLLLFTYRLIAAATKRLSTFLPFLAKASEISAAPSGFPAASKHSAIRAGMLPGRGPLSLRVRLRRLPPLASASASRSFTRSSSNSRSRMAIASRITWASTSLIGRYYLLPVADSSVHCSVTVKRDRQDCCSTLGCGRSSRLRVSE